MHTNQTTNKRARPVSRLLPAAWRGSRLPSGSPPLGTGCRVWPAALIARSPSRQPPPRHGKAAVSTTTEPPLLPSTWRHAAQRTRRPNMDAAIVAVANGRGARPSGVRRAPTPRRRQSRTAKRPSLRRPCRLNGTSVGRPRWPRVGRGSERPAALQAVGRCGAPAGPTAAHPGHVRARDRAPDQKRPRTTGGVTRRRCRGRGGVTAPDGWRPGRRGGGRVARGNRATRVRDACHGCGRVESTLPPPAPQASTAGASSESTGT